VNFVAVEVGEKKIWHKTAQVKLKQEHKNEPKGRKILHGIEGRQACKILQKKKYLHEAWTIKFLKLLKYVRTV